MHPSISFVFWCSWQPTSVKFALDVAVENFRAIRHLPGPNDISRVQREFHKWELVNLAIKTKVVIFWLATRSLLLVTLSIYKNPFIYGETPNALALALMSWYCGLNLKRQKRYLLYKERSEHMWPIHSLLCGLVSRSPRAENWTWHITQDESSERWPLTLRLLLAFTQTFVPSIWNLLLDGGQAKIISLKASNLHFSWK